MVRNDVYKVGDGEFYSVVHFQDQSTNQLGPFASVFEACFAVEALGNQEPADPVAAWRGRGRFWLVPDNVGGWLLFLIRKDRSATEDTGLKFKTKQEACAAVNEASMLIHGEGK